MTGTSRARAAPDRDAGAARDRDAGMVTVETAIALGGFIAVVAMVLAGLAAILGQIQCTDAAREAARLVARGETQRAQQMAAEIAPGDAKVSISVTADTVTVTITADPAGGLLPGLRLRADAVAVREPEAADEPGDPEPTSSNPTAGGSSTTAAAPTAAAAPTTASVPTTTGGIR